MSTPSILDHFTALSDPRQSWKVIYPLPEILLVILCGVMAGADDFVEIEHWAKRKLDFLRRLLPFADCIPSHDTLNDVMNALPGEMFCECFTNWVAQLRDYDPEIVAIDGKTSRRAHGIMVALCILSLPGPPGKGWCWGKRPVIKRKTKSVPYPACSND